MQSLTMEFLLACLVLSCVLGGTASGTGGDFFSDFGGLMAADLADKAARSGGMIVAAKGAKCAALISYSSDITTGSQLTKSSSLSGNSPLARLMKQSTNDRVRLLDTSTVMASVGLVADANYLADNLFEEVTQHKFVFGSSIPVVRIAKTLSILAHSQTLQRNSRPFGVHSCLVGMNSYDHTPSSVGTSNTNPWGIYEVDVLGNVFPCKWTCLGPLEAAKSVVDELGKAGTELERTDDGFALLKTCITCLRNGLRNKEKYRGGEDGEEADTGVAVHSHELQAALLIVDSSAFPSHQVKMVSQEDLKKVLADIE